MAWGSSDDRGRPEAGRSNAGRFGHIARTGLTLVAYLFGVTLLLYLLAFVAFLVAS